MVGYKNILIVQTAFIGDAILASSLVEKMHAHLPGASVSILVRKGNEAVYRGHPYLKEVLVWNKTEKKIANLLHLLKRIRRNRYDCVINCHRYTSSGILTAFSGAKHTAGYKQNPLSFLFNHTVKHHIGDGRHEVNRYTQLVQDFTDDSVFKPKIYPEASDHEAVKDFTGGNFVCMAPASVWFTKQMPFEKWVQLCDATPQHVNICLLGAPADHDLCEKIKIASTHNGIQNLAGKLNLLQSAALMTKATMSFVNDSAPLHLASATNSPVTAFFCSTVPEFGFGPLSGNSHVISYENLNCKPCGLHGYKSCPLGHFKCGHLMPLPTPGTA